MSNGKISQLRGCMVDIPRIYLRRSLLMVDNCSQLISFISRSDGYQTEPLDGTVQQALLALTLAAGMANWMEHFHKAERKLRKEEVDKAFEKAAQKIDECREAYSFGFMQSSRADLETATQKDEKALNRWLDFFEHREIARKFKISSKKEDTIIPVTIKLCQGSLGAHKELQIKFPSTTLLAVVLYKLACKDNQVSLRESPNFFSQERHYYTPDGCQFERVSSDKSLESLGSHGTLSLFLLVGVLPYIVLTPLPNILRDIRRPDSCLFLTDLRGRRIAIKSSDMEKRLTSASLHGDVLIDQNAPLWPIIKKGTEGEGFYHYEHWFLMVDSKKGALHRLAAVKRQQGKRLAAAPTSAPSSPASPQARLAVTTSDTDVTMRFSSLTSIPSPRVAQPFTPLAYTAEQPAADPTPPSGKIPSPSQPVPPEKPASFENEPPVPPADVSASGTEPNVASTHSAAHMTAQKGFRAQAASNPPSTTTHSTPPPKPLNPPRVPDPQPPPKAPDPPKKTSFFRRVYNKVFT